MKPQKKSSLSVQIIATLLITVISICSVTSLAASTATINVSSYGQIMYTQPLSRLHTNGEFIKNDQGQTVRLTGVGLDASIIAQKLAAWGRSVHLDKMIDANVNVVRIFICYGWWTGEYTDYDFSIERDVYRAYIDDLVSTFNYAGIYCWINMEGSYEKQQEWAEDSSNWASTLQEIALRYKDYPNMIGIEPQNEPHDWCWGDNYYVRLGEVAEAIHEVNPNLLIFADTGIHGWAQFDSNFPLDEPNVVYCYHYYYRHSSVKATYATRDFETAKTQLESGLVNNLYWLKAQGYPVMDTEFGVARDADHPEYATFLQDYFDIMEKYGISWTYFHWDCDNRDTQYDMWYDGWATLTPQGEIVVDNITPLIVP